MITAYCSMMDSFILENVTQFYGTRALHDLGIKQSRK